MACLRQADLTHAADLPGAHLDIVSNNMNDAHRAFSLVHACMHKLEPVNQSCSFGLHVRETRVLPYLITRGCCVMIKLRLEAHLSRVRE